MAERLSPITNIGDIIVGVTGGNVDRFAIGPDGKAIIADSTSPYGMTWGAAGGGATGATGPQGTQGTQGSLGPTGATGAQGTQGTQGSLGATGATGATGPQGTQGTQGSIGSTGATGQSTTLINTVTGPSYTFVAADAGRAVSFTATGVITAHIPPNSDVNFNVGDTIVVRLASSTGTITVDGATGVIIDAASQTLNTQWSEVVLIQESATNTWWIASTPKGATGATGVTGPQGSQGTQGTQGSLGATGATGAQGTQGSIGPTGNDGAQGPQGTQGTQGSAGTNNLISPVVTSLGSAGSPAPAATDNVYKLTTQTVTGNFKTTSGTANDGQILIIQITGSAATVNLTWPDATFGFTGSFFQQGTASGQLTLPLTTVRGKPIWMMFQYDTGNSVNRWRLVNKMLPI